MNPAHQSIEVNCQLTLKMRSSPKLGSIFRGGNGEASGREDEDPEVKGCVAS